MEDRLSLRANEVLQILKAQGESWITRSQLAEKLGRKGRRLNQLDLEALGVLEGRGDIDVERRPDPRPVGFVAYYRVKQRAS